MVLEKFIDSVTFWCFYVAGCEKLSLVFSRLSFDQPDVGHYVFEVFFFLLDIQILTLGCLIIWVDFLLRMQRQHRLSDFLECIFFPRMCLSSWHVPSRRPSTATSTSRKPYSACSSAERRRSSRMERESEGENTFCLISQQSFLILLRCYLLHFAVNLRTHLPIDFWSRLQWH